MSLFKTKEIWTQSNHTEENFSVKSLAFFPSTDLISNSPYTDLIVTTSLSGVLRLYNVSPNFSNEDVEQQTDAAPNSLLLETSLEMPILQIDVGKFSRWVSYFLFTYVLLFFFLRPMKSSSSSVTQVLHLGSRCLNGTFF